MAKRNRAVVDEAAARRQARLAEIKRREKRREALRTFAIIGGVVLVVAAVAVGMVVAERSGSTSDSGSNASDPDLGAVQSFEVTANHETGPLTYDQTPPVGGDHNPYWLNCGTYPRPIPSENAVHSIEHGAVWVTYRPDLPGTDVETLRAAMPSTYAVLSPFPDLPAPVVASAWGKQLVLDGADDPRLGAFLREYVQGPQTPEPGASCTGGSDGTLPLGGAGGMSKP